MSIGEFIRTRRKELGLSVDELATRIGKNRATVYRYESSYIEKLPSDVLVPLAAALLMTPGDLIAKGAPAAAQASGDVSLSTDEEELLGKYRRLSDEGKEYVMDQVDFRLEKEARDALKAREGAGVA